MQSEMGHNHINISVGWFTEKVKKLGLRLLPMLTGFALARTGILGAAGAMKGIYPFGAAFAAAVPNGWAAAAIAGILLGFLLPGNDAETLRCAASALAAAGIKWALAELKPVRSSPLFAPAAAFAGVVLTGMVVSASVGAAIGYDIVAYLAEGSVAAAGAYFFSRAISGWKERGLRIPCVQDRYCTAAALCIAAIPMCRVSIFGISPGSAALMVLVMAAALRLGAAWGGLAGIACGMVMALADGRFAVLGVMAAAGMTGALFAPLGRIALSAAFSISCALGVLASGQVDVYLLVEAAAAAVAFPIIKEERLDFLFEIICGEERSRRAAKTDEYMSLRLTDAAKGLEEASKTVCEVYDRLERLDAPGEGIVCRRATEELCKDCAISRFCWETAREQTQAMFDSLSGILRTDGRLCRANTTEQIRTRCARWGEMAERVNAIYAEYTANEGARRRIAQVRQAVAGQLNGCGQLLSDLARDSIRNRGENERLAAAVSETLENYDVSAEDVCCLRRDDGSVRISMTVRRSERYPEPEHDARDILCDELGLRLSEPETRREGDSLLVTMESLPVYSLSVGVSRHSRGGGRLCGDACEVLENVDGAAFVILSDGMGTGGRAAVDSAMTCDLMKRLLKAGFSEEGAMELVNSAMQISSEEESLVTLDCARVNLRTGAVLFSKAGAADSYILKRGRAERVVSDSLPLGIMRGTDSRKTEIGIEEGDVVLMVSDGAAQTGDDWLMTELEHCQTEDVNRLAKDIMALAAARCGAEDDDITVIAFRLERNEEGSEEEFAA